MSVPSELGYSRHHEWVRIERDIATVGITEHAVDALGDIVYVELPDVGLVLVMDETCGEVESTKSVSALYAPLDGKVIEINDAVLSDPQVINEQPYLGGWLFKATVLSPPGLLSADAYQRLLAEERPDAR